MTRTYDADGFRRILPTDKHAGLTEFRVGERCFQAAGYGAEADRRVVGLARERIEERG